MTLNIGRDHNHKGFLVKGWFSEPQKTWYKDTVKKIKNGIIVEIGVYGGASLLSIVDDCIKNNNVIFGIDPWENHDNIAAWGDVTDEELHQWMPILKERRINLENIIKTLKYEKTIKLIQSFSDDAVDKFSEVDVVFIDGNHTYESVKKDITNWFPKTNYVIGGHDFQREPIKRAVVDFCSKNNIDYKVYNEIWEIKK